MGDWPLATILTPGDGGFVSTYTSLAALNTSTFASTAWPSANLALFVPFVLDRPRTVYKMAAGAGATAGSNNFDIGIYDRFGNRKVSSGATAKGSSVEHIIDVTDTVIGPGLYYLAMSADGTGNYVMLTPSGTAPVPLQKSRAYGCLQMATAYTLPNPATFAAYSTSAVIPLVGAWFRSY